MTKHNLKIERIEMNCIKISSEIGATRFYDLDKWTVQAAIANYVEDEMTE